MTRGEGGSDEETFLGFVWMENLRTWSGLIVHLYFAAEPLKVSKKKNPMIENRFEKFIYKPNFERFFFFFGAIKFEIHFETHRHSQ